MTCITAVNAITFFALAVIVVAIVIAAAFLTFAPHSFQPTCTYLAVMLLLAIPLVVLTSRYRQRTQQKRRICDYLLPTAGGGTLVSYQQLHDDSARSKSASQSTIVPDINVSKPPKCNDKVSGGRTVSKVDANDGDTKRKESDSPCKNANGLMVFSIQSLNFVPEKLIEIKNQNDGFVRF